MVDSENEVPEEFPDERMSAVSPDTVWHWWATQYPSKLARFKQNTPERQAAKRAFFEERLGGWGENIWSEDLDDANQLFGDLGTGQKETIAQAILDFVGYE